MRVLFDTNVVLDVLLARDPHAEVAAGLFALADRGKLDGSLCATTVTTIYYLATKTVGRAKANGHVREVMNLFDVAPVDGAILARAMELGFADFEDAVVHESATASGVTAIVTRNGEDFEKASLPVFSPVELMAAVVSGSS